MAYTSLVPKCYVLTAASGSLADIMNALIAHFTAAPGYWQLKAGVTNSVAGQAFLITEKAAPQYNLNFRVTTTNATAGVIDREKTITNCGATGSAPTGASSKASPENAYTTATAMAKGIYVIELPHTVYCLCWGVGYTLVVRSFCGGEGVEVQDPVCQALGMTGEFVTTGVPSFTAAPGNWLAVGGNTTTSSGQIKIGDALWGGMNANLTFVQTTVAPVNAGTLENNILQPIQVYGAGTLGNRIIGNTKHLMLAPVRTGIYTTQVCRVLQVGADSWLHINSSATASNLVLVWEAGVIPSTPV